MIEGQGAAIRDIIYAIKKIAGADGIKKAQLVMGTVKSVDESKKTCKVDVTLGDACQSISDVNLNASSNDGFTQFPAIESDILITLMPDNSAYMVACEDITKVVCYIDASNQFEFDKDGFKFNNGLNGGLINITQQTLKLNQLVTELQAQLVLIAAGIAAGGGSYSPATLSAFNKTDFEDTKIKH